MSAPKVLGVSQVSVPEKLTAELVKRAYRYRYTTPETVFHCVWLWGEANVGVFGDGENGTYEWFFWRGEEGTLETSNCGYGSTSVALRDVLIKAEGGTAENIAAAAALGDVLTPLEKIREYFSPAGFHFDREGHLSIGKLVVKIEDTITRLRGAK